MGSGYSRRVSTPNHLVNATLTLERDDPTQGAALNGRNKFMSLEKQQFFSPDIEQFCEAVRAAPEAAPWIKLAHNLSAFSTDIIYSVSIPAGGPRFVAAGLFGRTHQSIQASITLIERGMIGDGRCVLRSATENAIALSALAKDQTFTEQLVSASNAESLKLANTILDNPFLRDEIPSAETINLESERARLRALPEQSRRSIIWGNVAAKCCPDLYNTLYRILSNDGTHVTMNALARRFEMKDGVATQMKFGPDTLDLVSSLRAACAVFLHSIGSFIQVFSNSAWESKLREMTQQFENIPFNELQW